MCCHRAAIDWGVSCRPSEISGRSPDGAFEPPRRQFLLLAGLRLLLEIPAGAQAAWAFHIVLDETATLPVLRGVRRVLFEIGVVAWVLVIAPVNVILLGVTIGIAHTVFCVLISLLFLDGLLFTYRKLPFTCSMSEDRTYLGLAFAAWVAMFLVYAYVVTIIEAGLLQGVIRFAFSLCVLFGLWIYLQIRKRDWAMLNTDWI